LYYERLKDSGELPIIGVNTYQAPNIHEEMDKEIELTRANSDEKDEQIKRLQDFQKEHADVSEKYLRRLKEVALHNGNIFEELLTTVRYCSLGQITNVLYEVGGRYRRNM
jgi:methylmalonyl-CoA mutase